MSLIAQNFDTFRIYVKRGTRGNRFPGRVSNMHARSSRSAGSINPPIRRVITSTTAYRRRSSSRRSLSFSLILLFLRFPSADYLRAVELLIELTERLRFRLLQIAERADRNRRVLPIADRKRSPRPRVEFSAGPRSDVTRAQLIADHLHRIGAGCELTLCTRKFPRRKCFSFRDDVSATASAGWCREKSYVIRGTR